MHTDNEEKAKAEAVKKKEIGRQTAVTLIEEMRFLGTLANRSDNDDLIDAPDKRPDFQIINGQDAAKSDSAGNFMANVAGLRYCVADGEVGRTGLFDIDHTHAFSDIQKKQKALLTYLNDAVNKDFAEGFLSASEIEKYFGKKDGKIKGTRRFYKLCYNDIDNLLLLCHSCNMHKSNKESLEWFGKQEPFLGDKFVASVEAAGGFHDGIIIKKVMKTDQDTPVVNIGGVNCTLHAGQEKVFGMGEFVANWFEDANPGYAKDIVNAYKDIWLSLKGVFQTRLLEEGEKARQAKKESGKLASVLVKTIETVDEHYGITSKSSLSPGGSVSQSSSDDDLDKQSRLNSIDRQVKTVFKQMHDIKRFYKAISNNRSVVDITKQDVYGLLEDFQLYSLGSSQQKKALEEMKNLIASLDASSPITKDLAKEIIKTAVYNHSSEKLEDERRAAEAKAEENQKIAEGTRKELEQAQKQLIAQSELIARLQAAQNASYDGQRAGSSRDLTPTSSSDALLFENHDDPRKRKKSPSDLPTEDKSDADEESRENKRIASPGK